MLAKNWTAKFQTGDIKISSPKLISWRSGYLNDAGLLNRISELMWFDLYVLDKKFGVSPNEILKSVQELESGETAKGVKAAAEFRNPPLRGLWHKHYFSAHFILQNITLGHGKNGPETLIDEVFDAKNSPIVTEQMAKELAHRVVHDPLNKRNADGKLTGEWIVFTKQGGMNHYLAVNTHAAGDQFIYDRITDHCAVDFPQLPAWLNDLKSQWFSRTHP